MAQHKRIYTMKPVTLKVIALFGLLTILCSTPALAQQPLDKQTVSDAYVYLLGRVIVIRQEQNDLKESGLSYNTIKYNPVGSADFVNPNLDVAYLEAWIAVDDETPVLLEIPEIKDRYYTLHSAFARAGLAGFPVGARGT